MNFEISYKDSANWAEKQIQIYLKFDYPEVQPIFNGIKDSANKEK